MHVNLTRSMRAFDTNSILLMTDDASLFKIVFL